MQESAGPSSTWLPRSQVESNDDINNDAWPELWQENQERYFLRRNKRTQSPSNVFPDQNEDNERMLDKFEYSLLGEPSSRTRGLIVQKKFNDNSCGTESPELSDQILIQLREELKKGVQKRKPCTRLTVGLKINLTRPQQFDRISISGLRERSTILKRRMLLEREIRDTKRKSEALKIAKMNTIPIDVNAINFNSLKITADPEIDFNYIRGMTALNFYGKEHRSPIQEAILEDTVTYRPDIIKKLSNLHIRKQFVQCKYRAIDNANTKKENAIDGDILGRTLNLNISDDDKYEISFSKF